MCKVAAGERFAWESNFRPRPNVVSFSSFRAFVVLLFVLGCHRLSQIDFISPPLCNPTRRETNAANRGLLLSCSAKQANCPEKRLQNIDHVEQENVPGATLADLEQFSKYSAFLALFFRGEQPRAAGSLAKRYCKCPQSLSMFSRLHCHPQFPQPAMQESRHRCVGFSQAASRL
jgi:hypothetical protein